jgi:hypothetical protein
MSEKNDVSEISTDDIKELDKVSKNIKDVSAANSINKLLYKFKQSAKNKNIICVLIQQLKKLLEKQKQQNKYLNMVFYFLNLHYYFLY